MCKMQIVEIQMSEMNIFSICYEPGLRIRVELIGPGPDAKKTGSSSDPKKTDPTYFRPNKFRP